MEDNEFGNIISILVLISLISAMIIIFSDVPYLSPDVTPQYDISEGKYVKEKIIQQIHEKRAEHNLPPITIVDEIDGRTNAKVGIVSINNISHFDIIYDEKIKNISVSVYIPSEITSDKHIVIINGD